MKVSRPPLLPASLLRYGACCLFVAVGTLTSAAQTADSTESSASAPAAAASQPTSGGFSLFHSVGSMLSRLKKGVSSESPPTDNTSDHDAAKTMDPTPRAASTDMAFNIVDIENWSKTADVVLDPQCKTLVQPFGIADNAASLALLAGKLKLKGFIDGLQHQGQPAVRVDDVVKLAARNLNWLPMSVEQYLGNAMLSDTEILDENKNKDAKRTYEQARAMLNDIVKDLPQPLPYDFKVLVRTTSYGNASALPGGIVLVDRDLFKKGSDPDFAYFVMSHEIAHILQRHQTRVYQARLVDGVDTVEGLSKFMTISSNPDPTVLLAYATSLKKLFVSFTEQQELQADSCAARMMSKRFPDAKQLESKMHSIDQQLGPITPTATDGPEGNQLLDHLKYLGNGILERHPNTSQRRSNLQVAFRVSIGKK